MQVNCTRKADGTVRSRTKKVWLPTGCSCNPCKRKRRRRRRGRKGRRRGRKSEKGKKAKGTEMGFESKKPAKVTKKKVRVNSRIVGRYRYTPPGGNYTITPEKARKRRGRKNRR